MHFPRTMTYGLSHLYTNISHLQSVNVGVFLIFTHFLDESPRVISVPFARAPRHSHLPNSRESSHRPRVTSERKKKWIK